MKRLFAALATFSLAETFGRHPVMAGVLSLLGVGSGAVITTNLITPALTPFISSNFDPTQPIGTTNNGLKPNGGSGGAFAMPAGNSGGYAGSFALYGEMFVNPNLGTNGSELPFPGMFLAENSQPGVPQFTFQRTANGGIPGSNWEFGTGVLNATPSATPGSGYATGIYPWKAIGGGCSREPSGLWRGGGTLIYINDPGFGCTTAPSLNMQTIPGAGAQQTGITATCSSGGAGMLITTSVPVLPAAQPGLTYALSGFTTSGGTSINTTLTAVTVTGSGPYNVVGTATGTCPTISSTGNFESGTGAAFSFANAGFGGVGITTHNGDHICSVMGEYGDDSAFPGAQFFSMTDIKGNALTGSPALVPYSNMGTASATGSTTNGSNVLTISSTTPFPITSAAWSNTVGGFPNLGLVTFQVSSNPGFTPGSHFLVSGMSPSSVNGYYVAVNGTNSTQVIGNQMTGANGIPQVYANPGAISTATTPQLVSVIIPGMIPLGSTAGGAITPAGMLVNPYGAGGTSGTGGAGTYQMSSNASITITNGLIFFYNSFYYSAALSNNPAGGVATVRPQGTTGDFIGTLGTSNPNISGSLHANWGGGLGNFAMLAGALPPDSTAAPSTADLASICTKQTDIQSYARDSDDGGQTHQGPVSLWPG